MTLVEKILVPDLLFDGYFSKPTVYLRVCRLFRGTFSREDDKRLWKQWECWLLKKADSSLCMGGSLKLSFYHEWELPASLTSQHKFQAVHQVLRSSLYVHSFCLGIVNRCLCFVKTLWLKNVKRESFQTLICQSAVKVLWHPPWNVMPCARMHTWQCAHTQAVVPHLKACCAFTSVVTSASFVKRKRATTGMSGCILVSRLWNIWYEKEFVPLPSTVEWCRHNWSMVIHSQELVAVIRAVPSFLRTKIVHSAAHV